MSSSRFQAAPSRPAIMRSIVLIESIIIISLTIVLRILTFERMYAPGDMDFDEPIYLERALVYLESMLRGDFGAIINDPINIEHPQLAKFLFSLGIGLGNLFGTDELYAARMISVVMAAIISLVLYLEFGRIPAYLWIVSTWSLKYTSQVYLEASVAMFSILALVTYMRYERQLWEPDSSGNYRLLILSAIFAAAAFASKYTAIVTVVLIFVLLSLRGPSVRVKELSITSGTFFPSLWSSTKPQVIWGLTFLVGLVLMNPRMLNPAGFIESLQYHITYSQSDQAQYPPASGPLGQLHWLLEGNNPTLWHPDFPVPYIDDLLFRVSIVGLVLFILIVNWRPIFPQFFITKERQLYSIMTYFYLLNTIFLMMWQTKWPQYLVLWFIPVVIFCGFLFLFVYRLIQFQLRDKVTKKDIALPNDRGGQKIDPGKIKVSTVFMLVMILIMVLLAIITIQAI